MIKNRFIQLIGRIFIFAVMVAATILSLGIIEPNPNWYVWYTNLSNYFCLLIVLSEIIATIIKIGHDDTKGCGDISAGLKFAALIDIIVTFVVYNFLADNMFSADYWYDFKSVLMHYVCPLLFVLDWLLFAKHANTRWFYPILVLVFPLIYTGYILLRGYFIAGSAESWQIIYPYPFLNVTELGYLGVGLWVLALAGVVVTVSYLICIIDNIPNFARMHRERKAKKQAKKIAKQEKKQAMRHAEQERKQKILDAEREKMQGLKSGEKTKVKLTRKQKKFYKTQKKIDKQQELVNKQQAKLDKKQDKYNEKRSSKLAKKHTRKNFKNDNI